jgi:cob(I)alamin adenosyltransferase
MMPKFYSKTGDDGTTGTLGKQRLEKYDLRIEAIGTIDECSAILGLARSLADNELAMEISGIQRRLYELMAEIAVTDVETNRFTKITETVVKEVEERIEVYSRKVEMPTGFILPGDSTLSATFSMSRTVVRRAERRIAELLSLGKIENKELLIYLNRLSSLMYLMELFTATEAGKSHTLSMAKDKTK